MPRLGLGDLGAARRRLPSRAATASHFSFSASTACTTAEPPIATERLANVPTPRGTSFESPKRSSTSSRPTPSRSAAIWANVVSWPWPCGDEPLRTSSRPVGSSSASAVSNSPPARSTYIPKPVPTTRSSSEWRSGSTSSSAQVEAARVVARVVGPAERRLVRELADEVAPAQLERVDPELARRDVDRALEEVRGLGPPGAAVRAGGHLVRARCPTISTSAAWMS